MNVTLLPFGPLLERTGGSVSDLARRVRVSRRQLMRLKAAGGLNVFVADVFAERLGEHPVNIWQDEWLDAESGETDDLTQLSLFFD